MSHESSSLLGSSALYGLRCELGATVALPTTIRIKSLCAVTAHLELLRNTSGVHMRPESSNGLHDEILLRQNSVALDKSSGRDALPPTSGITTGPTSNFVLSVTWNIVRLIAEVRLLQSDPLPQVVTDPLP